MSRSRKKCGVIKDNGRSKKYNKRLANKAVRPIDNGTGIRYCVAYHGSSENYWEFTTHEAAMKRVRELVYGVARKLDKKE